MKKIMKKMPKKVLSMLLAVIMIASCMSVCFSVLAEGISFNVTSGSPAIPLYVGYKIAKSNLTFNSGAVTTLADSSDATVVAIEGDYLVGKKAGRATVKLGDNTVHVIVADKGASENVNDFSLYYQDFSTDSSLTNWVAGSQTVYINKDQTNFSGIFESADFKYSASAMSYDNTEKALKVVANNTTTSNSKKSGTNATFLKSDIVKDFGDYTVSADIKRSSNASSWSQIGILSRVLLSSNPESTANENKIMSSGTTTRALSLRFRQRGAVMVSGVAIDSDYRSLTDDQNTYTYFSGNLSANDFKDSGTKKIAAGDSKNITVDYRGGNFKYSLDDAIVLDTTGTIKYFDLSMGNNDSSSFSLSYGAENTLSDYSTKYTDMKISSKGTIGFVNGCTSNLYIYNVRVDAANIKDINNNWGFMEEVTGGGSEEPEPEEPEPEDPTPTDDDDDTEPESSGATFNVTVESPAIPLNVGKKIARRELIFVGLGKTGEELQWTKTDGQTFTDDDVKVTQYYIKGYKAGVYGFTVSEKEDSTKTQKVWVVVKSAGVTDYSIVDLDFSNSNAFNQSDWLQGTWNYTAETLGAYVWDSQNFNGGKYKEIHGLENNEETTDYAPEKYNLTEASYMTGRYQKSATDVASYDNTKQAIKIPAATGTDYGLTNAIVYKSEALKDFYDYTVEAGMSSSGGVGESMAAAPGLLARVQANYSAGNGNYILTDRKSTSLKFRNYGGVTIFGIDTYDEYQNHSPWKQPTLLNAATLTQYTSGTIDDYFMCDDKSKVFYPDGNERAIKAEFDGINIKYSMGENVIFDSSLSSYNLTKIYIGGKATSSLKGASVLNRKNYAGAGNDYARAINASPNDVAPAGNLSHGTVGFTNNYGNDLYIHSLKVSAKNILDQATSIPTILRDFSSSSDTPVPAGAGDYDNLPAGTFPVVPNSPAIPLYVNQSLTLDQISVKLHDSETDKDVWVNGASTDLTWEKQEGRAARLSEDRTKFEGRMTGNTLFTVTYKTGDPQNVWIIVNEKNDSDFYIVDYNFDEGDDLGDWQLARVEPTNNTTGANYIYSTGNYLASSEVSKHYLDPSIKVYADDNSEITKTGLVLGSYWASNGTLATFIARKELEDFADYTVNAQMSFKSSVKDKATEGVIDATGMFARVNLDDAMYGDKSAIKPAETHVLSSTEKSLHFRFRNYGGVTISAYKYGDTSGAFDNSHPYATFFTVAQGEEAANVAASLWKGDSLKEERVWIEDASNATAYTLRNVELKLDGKGVAYSVDGNKIFDTITEGNTIYGVTVDANDMGTVVDNKYTNFNTGVYPDTCPTPFPYNYDAQQETMEVTTGTIGFSNGINTNTIIYSVNVQPENILYAKDLSLDLNYVSETYEDYFIEAGTPIVPIKKGYRAPLSKLYIEMPEGTAGRDVDGFVRADSDTLDWKLVNSKESTLGVAVVGTDDDGNKAIEGRSIGRICFTVSDKTNTDLKQNVWVVVSEPTDTENSNVLLDLDFTDTTNANVFDKERWICGSSNDIDYDVGYQGWQLTKNNSGQANYHHGYQNGAFTYIPQSDVLGYADVSVNGDIKRALKLASERGTTADAGAVTRIAVYKSDMLSDFKDYKISADVANVMTTKDENTISSIGIMARTVINPNASKAGDLVIDAQAKSTMFRMRNYGGLGIFAYRGDNDIDCEEKEAKEKPGLQDATKHERMWIAGNYEGTTYWTITPKAGEYISGNYLGYSTGRTDNSFVMKPDGATNSTPEVTPKSLSIELDDYDIEYVLNDHEILSTKNHAVMSAGGYYNIDSSSGKYSIGADVLYKDAKYDLSDGQTVATYKTNMQNPNIASLEDHTGTIGLSVNYGVDLYVLGLKVEAVNNVEQEVFQEKFELPTENINGIILRNRRVKLDDIKNGFTHADVRNNDYEIKNNVFMAYSVADGIELTSGDTTINITIKETEYEAEADDKIFAGESFADNEMQIIPGSGPNDYRVTVNRLKDNLGWEDPYEIIPGTLVLKNTSDDAAVKIVNGNNDGCSYDFTVIDPLTFIIHAQYTTLDANTAKLAVLGSTIRIPATYGQGEAIRFLTRFPELRAKGGNYERAYTWSPEFEKTKDGTEYDKYISYGAFIVPTALLNATDEKGFVVPEGFNPQTAREFSMGDYRIRNIPVKTLSNVTDKYSDAWFILEYGNLDNEYSINVLDLPLTFVSYIYYQDKAGNCNYIFSESESKSYYDVYKEAYPIINADKDLLKAIKATYRYENAGKTTFAVDVRGNYQLNWWMTDSSGTKITGAGYSGTVNAPAGRVAVTVNSQDGMQFHASLKGRANDYSSDSGVGLIKYDGGNKNANFYIDASGFYHEEGEEPSVPMVDSVANLNNTYVKAQAGTLNVAYVGGSVTDGTGPGDTRITECWRKKTTDWLKQQFNAATINEKSFGIGGSSSVWAAPRFEHDVLSNGTKPDLIFIDCSINDRYIGSNNNSGKKPWEKESAALMDSMIRQARAKYPDVDIVVVTVPDRDTIKLDEAPNAAAHRKVADYERVNYIDLTSTVRELTYTSGALDNTKWNQYYAVNGKTNDVHPNADGYAEYAKYITGQLETKFSAASTDATLVGVVNYKQPETPYNDNVCKVPTKYEIIPANSTRITVKSGTWTEKGYPKDSGNIRDYSKFNKVDETYKYAMHAAQDTEIEFKFTGVSLHMLGTFTKGANISVTLDGVSYDSGRQIASSAIDKAAGEVYLYDNLEEKEHTVTIKVNGTANADFGCFAVGKVNSDIEGEKKNQ